MATIYNSDVTKELREGGKISLRDAIPTQLAEKVVPVMEVNPKLLKVTNFIKRGTLNNATSATLATTDAINETFITGAYLSVMKDVTATSLYFRINCVIGGASTSLLALGSLTLTAGSKDVSIMFRDPIKVDKSSALTLVASTNVGNFILEGGICGYLDNNSNA